MNIIQRVTEIQSHQVKTISKIVQIQTLIQAQTLTQQQIEEASNPNPITYSFDQWSVEESHLSSELYIKTVDIFHHIWHINIFFHLTNFLSRYI